MAGFLRYVDYMVRHFKGRVAYYEVCNEWHAMPGGNVVRDYFKILRATIPVIKKADPNARIMLGAVGFDPGTILRCLGAPALSGIKGGKLELAGHTVAIAQRASAKDVLLEVDAGRDAEAGFVIRAKDHQNYLLANYAPGMGGIYFHEVANGAWGPVLDHVAVEDISRDIHLTAKVEGARVTFSLSDGAKEFTTTHQIQRYDESGQFGLFHNRTTRQTFDNFSISELAGRKIFADSFDRPDGPARGWDAGEATFVAPEKLAPQVDAISWHPWYQADPDGANFQRYRQDMARFKKDCEALGFKGIYVASEWTWAAPYPGHPDWCTEMTKAKYSAQLMTAHAGMDIVSLYNETFQTGRLEWDVTLLRNSSFQVDPITPAQPQPIYYVLRNISTALDGYRAASFPVEFSGEKEFECYTFRRTDSDRMLAAWIPGKTQDGIVESKSDVTLSGTRARKAWVIDVFNGTQQELNVTHNANDTVLKGMLIKDYPTFVQVRK